MSNDKHLRQFVIWRFIWTLVGIIIAEEAMLYFIRHVMLPLCVNIGIFNGDLKIQSVINAVVNSGEYILISVLIVIFAFVAMPIITGAYIYSVAVAREIRKTEDEFINAQRENDRQRYLIISDIAHDLKTPMTTVSGYAQALSDGLVKEEEQAEYLSAITSKTNRMNDMINMLFDYTRLNSEGFSVARSRTDACEFLREIVASRFHDIEEAGDEIEVDIPESQIFLKLDRIQMTRVINNLITNAIRHNPRGTKINVTLKDDGDDLRFFVADSGDKIGDELAAGLFEPFVMGDESRQSKGGTGLGLSIARKIVELHGSSIKLVQKPEVTRYQLGSEYNKAFVIIFKNEE